VRQPVARAAFVRGAVVVRRSLLIALVARLFACKFKGPGPSNVSALKQNKTFGRNTGVQF
jgi:hypothetical protein